MLGHHEQEGWAAGMKEQEHQKEQKNKDIRCFPLQIGMSYCHGLGGNQVFAVTKKLQVG